MNQPSAIAVPGATKRAPRRLLGATVVLVLLGIGQCAWANIAWPKDFTARYGSYNSPTDNTVEVAYFLPDGEGCVEGNQPPNDTVIDSIAINWCRTSTDLGSWDGQFWAESLGLDPQPRCDGGGWKYGGLGKQIWQSAGNEARGCGRWYTVELEDALAPGLWVIGLNFWDGSDMIHHNSGNHNSNRAIELTAPDAD